MVRSSVLVKRVEDRTGPDPCHASQDNSQHSGAARIHHCLLRVTYSEAVQKLIKGLQSTGDIFVHFAHLETVVLETGHKLKSDDVQLLTEALRKVCRAEVRHRTCDEAHKLALDAKKGAAYSPGAGLLSPFWCLGDNWWDKW